jgi:O-antigen/teichoic acid export membrane protein
VAEDAPGLKGTPPVLPGVLDVLAASTLLLWPFQLVALAALALLWVLSGLGAGIWAAIGVFVAQLVAIYWWLRRNKQTDIPKDVAPQSAKVEEFMSGRISRPRIISQLLPS